MVKNLVLLLGIMSSLLSQTSPATAATSGTSCPKSEQVKLASYNVHAESWMDLPKYWPFRRAAILETLGALDADIIHLQEVQEQRTQDIHLAMPQFQLSLGPQGLATLVRSDTWEIRKSHTITGHDELAVQELHLRYRQGGEIGDKILWNVWLKPSRWQATTVSQTIDELLSSRADKPDMISLSLRAPDRQVHDRSSWHRLLYKHNLRHADPHSFAITTNGWWAIKWTTQDWHDAVIHQRSWSLTEAQLLRRKQKGAYPSLHFPLLTHFCQRQELMVGQ